MFGYKLSVLKQKLFPALFTSDDLHRILKERNIDVGDHTIFYNPGRTVIDTSRPALLKIGDYCKITSGVVILTHDYSRSVLRRVYGEVIGEGKYTTIGDNVFIGMNSIVLMGSRIGSNVIVGAGSVVSGEIPNNVVVGGIPAKVIRSLESHYKIMKKRAITDAEEYYRLFQEKFGRKPTIGEMNPFYELFLPRTVQALRDNGISMELGGDDEQEVLRAFLSSYPVFNGYDAFMQYCERNKDRHVG